MRIKAGLLLLVWLATACGRDVTGPAPRPGDAILIVRAGELAPTATLRMDKRQQQGLLGTQTWEQRPGVILHADSGLIIPKSYLRLKVGTRLVVHTDADEVSGSLMVPSELARPRPQVLRELPFSDMTGILDARPGRYALDVHGVWPQGQAWFLFGIDLVADAD
jgi:hypothetical protein